MINNSSVYTVKDIMQQLQIGKNTAYQLVKSGAFPVIKIGDTYRVSKEVFDRWINGEMI